MGKEVWVRPPIPGQWQNEEKKKVTEEVDRNGTKDRTRVREAWRRGARRSSRRKAAKRVFE